MTKEKVAGAANRAMVRLMRTGLALGWAVAVWAITLTPGSPGAVAGGFQLCFVCGSRGPADVLLNLVLFLPLGFLVGLRWSPWVALLVGLLVSAGIESVQLLLPGRSSTLSDLMANGVGAGIGATLPSLLRLWLTRRRWEAQLISIAIPALYLAVAGLAQKGIGGDASRIGLDTGLEGYDGAVLSASLNGEDLPPGPYPGGMPEGGLDGEWDFRGEIVLGFPPRSLTPILRLYDLDAIGIMWLGAQGTDLVFRHRNKGVEFGLDYPEVRYPGALAGFEEGDTVRIGVRRLPESLCLWVEDQEMCGLGITPGRSWAVLLNREGASNSARILLDAVWMGALFVGIGLFGGRVRTVLFLSPVAAIAVLVVVRATPLVAGSFTQWIGLALGVGAGWLLRPLVRDLVDVDSPS